MAVSLASPIKSHSLPRIHQPMAAADSRFVNAESILTTAFQLRDQGVYTHYNLLVQQLKQETELFRWYRMLAACATRVKVTDVDLLDAVFRFDWYKHDLETIAAYNEFLFHLNTGNASGDFAKLSVFRIVRSFIPTRLIDIWQAYQPQVTPEKVVEQIHHLLQRILYNMPMVSQVVWLAIVETFPHRSFAVEVQRCFLRNLFTMMNYCHVLKERLLLLVVERILVIDTEYKPDASQQDEFSSKPKAVLYDDLLFDMDSFQLVRREVPSFKKSLDVDNEEMAGKLDGTMDIVFEYLGSRPAHELDESFNFLIKAFDKLILQTHRSRYVQYSMFYLCSLKPVFAESFLGYLFTATFTDTNPPIVRQNAASYLGSFVARASFLSGFNVKRVVEQLMPWIHDYIDRNPNQQPDASKHGVFFYVFQALMLIILFRHQQLTELDSHCIRKLELERLIHANVNPIKMCGNQNMATEFIKLLRQYGVKVSNILQRNKKLILPSKTSAGADNVIAAHFPFDPYCLAVSGRYIKPLFNSWVRPQETGYDTDGETELDDRPHVGQLDQDDESQTNSMMQMMDMGRGIHPELGTSIGKTNSWSERMQMGGSGSFSGSFDPEKFVIEDMDSDNAVGSVPRRVLFGFNPGASTD